MIEAILNKENKIANNQYKNCIKIHSIYENKMIDLLKNEVIT